MPVSDNQRKGRRERLGLKDTRPYQWVPGEGPCPARVMLVGERPGELEAKTAHPFVGAAGQYLRKFAHIVGIDLSTIYITNLVKEFTNYDKPTTEEIKFWRPILDSEIACVQPDIIGLLGTFAVEAVLGVERAGLERTHGVPMYANIGGRNIVVVPMFHPAAGIYKLDSMTYVMDDIKALRMVMDGKLTPITDHWKGAESYNHWNGSGATVRGDVAIDTESAGRARPWCLTYSGDPGVAWLQYPGECSQFESDTVYLHNSMHDLGVLRSLGVTIREEQFRDTMVWAYLLQLEPQGLKDLAYRHCGMLMESYDDIIGLASRDLAIAYLEGVNACEWNEAGTYVVVEGGKARIAHPNSINQRVQRILNDVYADKRRKNGDPVNPRQRWENIEDYIKAEVVAELGEMPEATLDDVPRGKAERYALRDADATLRIAKVLEAKINALGLDRASQIDHDVLPIFDRMQHCGIQLADPSFWDALGRKCDQLMGIAVKKIWDKTNIEINPDSDDQVRMLLFGDGKEIKGLGLTVTKYTKGGKEGKGEQLPSTMDKALEAIWREHPVVDDILDYREASKVKNSYVAPLERAAAIGDGRVHCTFRLTRVVSGRPSATKPNLLAIPVRSGLGKEIRGGFVAPDGRVIGDWDEDQIEMRYMADESGDERLCKLFIDGSRDVHTDTAAKMFSVAYGNVRVEQRYAAKRVGFGVITGITEHGLVDQMALARALRPDGKPWTIDDCKLMIDGYFDISPGVKIFMNDAGDEAMRLGYVTDRWGRRRYLPGIWSPIPAVVDEARRQATSFKIQAGAQGYMKQGMKSVWDYVIKPRASDRDYNKRWPIEPLLQIYDSMVFEMDEELAVAGVGKDIVMCLTKTVDSRRGVPFTAKGGYGKTWLTVK